MELMELEMFMAVFEERSVQKAAARVSRTQPAVSIALRKLESRIGAQLMHRQRGDYSLTHAGKILYECASRMLALRDESLALLRGQNTCRTGRLCVGIASSERGPWMGELTATFGRKYPNVRLEVLHDRADVVLCDLMERRIDLAFLAPQVEFDRTNSDIAIFSVVFPAHGYGAVRPVWVASHRVGCSHTAKAFEEITASFARKNEMTRRVTGKGRQ